jgi:hypothetical protein
MKPEMTETAADARHSMPRLVLLRVDRPWSEYPLGTKAHSFMGGYWIRVKRGWKWHCGDTFPTPGGDACGACIELPEQNVKLCQPCPPSTPPRQETAAGQGLA